MFRGNPLSQVPNLLFTVDWAPSPPADAPTDPVEVWLPHPDSGMGDLTGIYEGRLVKRSGDGKKIVRSHRLWVNL
jgi:hypothetical protein